MYYTRRVLRGWPTWVLCYADLKVRVEVAPQQRLVGGNGEESRQHFRVEANLVHQQRAMDT